MQPWMKRFTGTAIASAWVIAAGCEPAYVSPGSTAYHAESATVQQSQRWQDPQFVTTRVNERLSMIEQRVRGDIATGQLPAESINEFNTRKARVLQTLAQATQDGIVDQGERQELRSEVQQAAEMSTTTQQQPYGQPTPGYGYYGGTTGGPQMQPQPQPPQRSYFDESWEWGF